MSKLARSSNRTRSAESLERRYVAMHLHAIEGSPVTAKQKQMFEMFDREGWSDEQRLAYILARAGAASR